MTALCLEPHDLWISKAIAARPKDREFCQALLDRDLVDRAMLKARLQTVTRIDAARRDRIADDWQL